MPGRYRSSSNDLGYKDRARKRALALLNISPADLGYADDWDDFAKANANTGATALPGWQENKAGTGAVTTNIAGGGSWVRATTGATNAGQELMTGSVGLVSNVTTVKWYQYWRFRILTAVDAQAKHIMGLFNIANNKTIGGGFNGALDPVNFALQYDGSLTGSSLSLGVAKDVGTHTLEIFGRGTTTVFAKFDEGAELSAVMAAAPADACFPIWGSLNGTTNAVRDLEVDYYYGLFPRV